MQELTIKYIKQSFKSQLKFFLFVFCLIFVFTTSWVTTRDDSFLSHIIYDFFMTGVIHPKNFSIFQIFTIIFCFKLINTYGISFSRENQSKEKFFLFVTIAHILFLLLNPQNKFIISIKIIGLYEITDHITYIIFAITLLFIKDKVFIILLKYFIRYVTIITICRSIILMILHIFSILQARIHNQDILLLESDSIIIFSIIGILLLYLFFFKNKNIYLILWMWFLFFQILTYRRTGVFFMLASSILLYFSNWYVFRKTRTNIKYLIRLATFALLIYIVIPKHNLDVFNKYYYRNFGEFLSSTTEYEIKEYNARNKHFDQSRYVIFVALEKLDFWGAGYGNPANQFTYKGSTSGVHNAYIGA